MQLIKRQEDWDPIRELEDLSSRFSRLFESKTRRTGNGEREALASMDWAPSCDISETDKEYRIRAALPSVKKEDVHVRAEDGVLTIQGERREEKEEKGATLHRRELTYGSFMRRFTIPDDGDDAKIDASFKDGMLNVVIPRTKDKTTRTKEIAVH